MKGKKLIRIFMTVVVAMALGPVSWAADINSTSFEEPQRGTIVGEAAEAVVGRVFGVEGDAADIKYHVIELTNHTPKHAALRSTLIPGWGQHFNNQKLKASVFFLATTGAIIGSAKFYGKSRDAYDDYEALGQKNSSRYDDYEKNLTAATILGSAAAVLWVFNIFDAYRNSYERLYSQNTRVDVAFSSDAAQIRVKKSF